MSANYGFGQNMFEIEDVEDAVRAVLLEVIGQTFAIIGMAVAKCSLGLFLLRLVSVNMIWHRMAIWATMAGLMLTSISVVFVYWLQCTPPAYLWDHRIRGGFCHINSVPAAFTLSSTYVPTEEVGSTTMWQSKASCLIANMMPIKFSASLSTSSSPSSLGYYSGALT